MRRIITNAQFIRAYRSAGLWFVGLYMEAFLRRYNELQDDSMKTHLIEEIYNNGKGPDKDEGGTRTRVNALFRIIESGRVEEVLEIVKQSKLTSCFHEVVATANDLLQRIRCGQVKVPI